MKSGRSSRRCAVPAACAISSGSPPPCWKAFPPPNATVPPASWTPRIGSASAAAWVVRVGTCNLRKAGSLRGLGEVREVEVEEDYQVCVRRSG